MFNRTQNDAIWGLIALFLTNQIARNTIDFKMNVIKLVKYLESRDVCHIQPSDAPSRYLTLTNFLKF